MYNYILVWDQISWLHEMNSFLFDLVIWFKYRTNNLLVPDLFEYEGYAVFSVVNL